MQIVGKYVSDARALLATQEPCDVQSALGLLEAALALSPRHEAALELRARSLLLLRRFRDVADMLQDYIPSFKAAAEVDDSSTSLSSDSSSGSSQSQQLSRERAKLLPSSFPSSEGNLTPPDAIFRCFSVADLKRKMLAGLHRNGDKEGQWRYTPHPPSLSLSPSTYTYTPFFATDPCDTQYWTGQKGRFFTTISPGFLFHYRFCVKISGLGVGGRKNPTEEVTHM